MHVDAQRVAGINVCSVSQRQKKKKAEKQEINLLQLAAFVGRFESVHGLLPLAQPAFKGRDD